MKCNNCNHEIMAGQKFCNHCGTKVANELQELDKVQASSDKTPKVVGTTQTNNDNKVDSSTKVNTNDQVDISGELNRHNQVEIYGEDTHIEKILANTTSEPSRNINSNNSRKKLPMIIGLIAIIIALVGGAIFLMITNNNTNKKLSKLEEGTDSLRDYVRENEIEFKYIEFIDECEEIVKEKQKDKIDEYNIQLEEKTEEAKDIAEKFSELKKEKLAKEENWKVLSPNDEELKNFSAKIEDIEKALEKVKLDEVEELLKDLDEVQHYVIQRRCDEIKTEIERIRNYIAHEIGGITLGVFEGEYAKIIELINKGNIIEAEELLAVQNDIINKLSSNLNYKFEVKQVDVNNFPQVKLYVSLQDLQTGESVRLDKDNLTLYEKIENATESTDIKKTISEVTQLNQVENLNISVVADASGSMNGPYMNMAKQVMSRFINSVQFEVGDKVSVMSFADQVSLYCGFTEDKATVQSSINMIGTNGATALYDALYTAVSQTAMQEGAKCVVAFTDGMDNVSRSTPDAVIDLACRYDIPVYIIGIGSYMDNYNVGYIATQTGGKYWDVADVGMIENIYSEIYREQKEMYLISYETAQKDVKDVNRMLSMMYDNGDSLCVTEKIYNPKIYLEAVEASSNLLNGEYVIPDSDTRYVTIADLNTLTKEQLRLARNEIYARRGRKFMDAELQKYFNSKSWYRGTIEPDAFKEEMLNDAEKANAYFIADYERLKGYLQ